MKLLNQSVLTMALVAFVASGIPQANGQTYTLVDTGQVQSYDNEGNVITPSSGDAFNGQDAQFTGVQFAFQDNGDGTVSDLNTGLTWQSTPTPQSFSWQEAVDYADTLVLGGYDDWRVPSLKELWSIADFSQGWPYLDTNYFDIAGQTVSKDEQFWASNYYIGTTTEGQTNAAFGVNSGTGHIKAYPANATGPMGNYVRVVRGDEYGVNDFEGNGDSTVTDQATGLMWAQDDSGVGMDWEDALAYAEGAELAGYSDWRLPDIKELQSIVDYSKSPSAVDAADQGPAIDTDLFNITELPGGTSNYDTDYGYFWSSTSAYFNPNDPEYFYAWYVAFGTSVDNDGNDTHGAGAVRFDTKYEGGALGEGGERYYNYVRLVRDVTAVSEPVQGDANGDGSFDFGDIEAFFLAITDPAAYAVQYPNVATSLADLNEDGNTDFGDIEAFFLVLTN